MENNLQPTNIPTNPPPQTPLEPKKSSNLKGVLIILAVLEIITILIAGYFGYQFIQLKKQVLGNQPTTTPTTNSSLPTSNLVQESSTPDVTVNWRTYTNTNYKFLIKYPSNWVSKSYDPADSRIPYLYNPDNKYSIQFGYHKDEPSTISEMTGKPIVTDLSNYEPTNINGIKVYVNNSLQGDDGNYMNYYFQISDGEYISILAPLTNGLSNLVWNDTAISLAKQIISTFKFTN